eukprot:scaffold207086_cov31-Tisochrysis_lutea.AAC.2
MGSKRWCYKRTTSRTCAGVHQCQASIIAPMILSQIFRRWVVAEVVALSFSFGSHVWCHSCQHDRGCCQEKQGRFSNASICLYRFVVVMSKRLACSFSELERAPTAPLS